MKNLKKQRNLEWLLGVVIILLLLLPIAAMFLLKNLTGSFFADNVQVITLCLFGIFWITAVIVMGLNTKKAVIIDAMTKNSKRVSTDRASFPSKRTNISIEELKKAFEAERFEISESLSGSFTATRKIPSFVSVTVIDNPEKEEEFIKMFVNAHAEVKYNLSKQKSYAIVFLVENITDEYKELSLDARALPCGCVLPVFYDKSENRAYYMGGDTGRLSSERPAQNTVKNIVLNYREPFPPKTEEDITQEEKDFNRLNIEEITEQLKSAPSEDKSYVVLMDEGAINIVLSENDNKIYFKKGIKGIVHRFYIDLDGKYIINSLDTVMYCSPKIKQAKLDDKLAFKKALEDYLDENGIPYEYDSSVAPIVK